MVLGGDTGNGMVEGRCYLYLKVSELIDTPFTQRLIPESTVRTPVLEGQVIVLGSGQWVYSTQSMYGKTVSDKESKKTYSNRGYIMTSRHCERRSVCLAVAFPPVASNSTLSFTSPKPHSEQPNALP